MNFFEDTEANITPTKFEKLCIELLIKTKALDKLDNVGV